MGWLDNVHGTPMMSLAQRLNFCVSDMTGHRVIGQATREPKFRFVRKCHEVAYLKVTLPDGTEPKGAVVVSDDGGDHTVLFLHPSRTGKEAWDLIHGTDDDVKALVNDADMVEERFKHRPSVATPDAVVDASDYSVVAWCFNHFNPERS